MTFNTVTSLLCSDFGVANAQSYQAPASSPGWKTHIILMSMPEITSNGDAFGESDFRMMDTEFGKALAIHVGVGTHKFGVTGNVTVPNNYGIYYFCNNLTDKSGNEYKDENLWSTEMNSNALVVKPFVISDDGKLTAMTLNSGSYVSHQDCWMTYMFCSSSGASEITIYMESSSNKTSPTGARFIGGTSYETSPSTFSAFVLSDTYTRQNLIPSMNRIEGMVA